MLGHVLNGSGSHTSLGHFGLGDVGLGNLALGNCALGGTGLGGFGGAALVAQTNWAPSFLTPIWIIAISLLMGLAATAVVYGVLALLSFIPPLGRLADDPRRGVTVSIVLGLILGGLAVMNYGPRADDPDYDHLLILPLLVAGLMLGFGIVYGMWRRTVREWPDLLTDSVVPYLLATAGVLIVLGLVSWQFVTDREEILASIPQVNLIGDGTSVQYADLDGIGDTDPDSAPFQPVDVSYRLRDLAEIRIETDRTIAIGDGPNPLAFTEPARRVFSDDSLVYRYVDRQTPPVPGDPTALHLQNRETDPARVKFTFISRPTVPEATSMVAIAVSVFMLMTAIVVLRQAAPRVWALGFSTAKNEMAQPLYLLLLLLGMATVVVFGFVPFNTLGDDIRVLKESGVTLIMVLALIQAVWSAGTTVTEEIDGRTALTVLSKPVSRRSFIIGKYLGIMLAILVMFAILAAVLLVVVSYKPIYDARETTRAATSWQEGYGEVLSTLPILALYFMETAAIAAVAVAMATRLPLLANFVVCFVVYLVGNLLGGLVTSVADKIPLVKFFAQFVAVIIPNLNSFNLTAAVDSGTTVPILYLAGAFNYLVVFVIAVWMLAMLMFEDRDLA